MQDAFPSQLQLETHHRYPDGLRMALAIHPLESSSGGDRRLALEVGLEFNEQWQSVLEGRVKWGLKGGELGLTLDSGVLFVEQDEGSYSFPERPSLRVSRRSRSEQEWVWTLTSDAVLNGAIALPHLATLAVRELPPGLTAKFAVNPADVYLRDAEGLWKHNISPNQHAVLDRALALVLYKSYFKPYLSLARSLPPETARPSNLTEEEAPALPSLKPIFDRVGSSETEHFLELAAMAELNPGRDFEGGNLLGTTLSSLDLSGVNLARANLRGADLSDADLSEANLSDAKLRGADLSGAYLGNANLRNADLHRASLALANLGGADLSGANLQEANLSNANPSSIKVEGAIFGQNPGLTEAMKLNLQQRGAIIRET